ncbi:Zn-dependent alcohol dehydrogenase, class III [Caulobacter sp. AP07]|uniref:NAD(P)-dependent alcohol dehydrogenase n=1 Tax=Caulobacter sp. AP07 TaxID=1144304 RepID=UPI000271EDF2|nr:NAD(P)-dependent alcohol dehydrogenase [Caulobacter sp. AP07]EJL30826.1 Zn-dependent alcohol dehydrogenase, class III [Caulobacter sp. AP07]
MQIQAAVAFEAHSPFVLRSVTIETPRDDEVLVRVVGVGLCHTDLVARDQFIPVPLPAVLGHEGSGVVELVGSAVTKVKPGDRVVMSFSSCGRCARCQEHLPSYCGQFRGLNLSGARPDGSSGLSLEGRAVSANFFGQSSFASHALTYERNLVRIDDADAPLELLGPLGCGFQTGAGGVMRALACPPGSTIAIFGGGPVGMSAVMGAVIQACASIILVEPIAARRDLALELGATHVVDPGDGDGDVAAAIRAILPGGVDFAFETSGRVAVAEAALAALSGHGLLGLVGVPARREDSLSVNLTAAVSAGLRIHGIVEGDSDLDGFIPQLVALRKAGRFPIDRLIKTFPLAQINEAVAAQARGDFVKAVLLP